MSQGQFPPFETIMCPFCECEEHKRPCRNPLEKQNNPTIETPFDWWVGQIQLKGLRWLITSCPVSARQSAAQRHSRHSKPHHFPLKFLSHLPLVLVYFEAAFRSGLSSKAVALCSGSSLWTQRVFLTSQFQYCAWQHCYACCVATSVPEGAKFKLSLSFSWLLFKLHFEVPDLNVAVVLMRGTPAFSEPARQKCRKPHSIMTHRLKTRNNWAVLELRFCVAERKDRCKSVMFCTCLSNASHCCSFVCQPGKAEAFRRSLCRNPPSLKTHKRPWHTDQHGQKLRPQKVVRANWQHVGTWSVALQSVAVHTTRSNTGWLITFNIS